MVAEGSKATSRVASDSDNSDWDDDVFEVPKIRFEIKASGKSLASMDELKAAVKTLNELANTNQLVKPNSRRQLMKAHQQVTRKEPEIPECHKFSDSFEVVDEGCNHFEISPVVEEEEEEEDESPAIRTVLPENLIVDNEGRRSRGALTTTSIGIALSTSLISAMLILPILYVLGYL